MFQHQARCSITLLVSVICWSCLISTTDAYAGGAAPYIDPVPDQQIIPNIDDHGDSPKTLESKLEITLQASDPENDPLFFRITSFKKEGAEIGLLEGITLDDSTGEFFWPVRPHQVGSYSITFQVKDCRPAAGQDDCTGSSATTITQIDVMLGEICSESGSSCTFLKNNQNGSNGTAGNLGDFYLCGDYDNDLSYHSVMSVGVLPQLDFLDKLRVSDFTLNPGSNQRGPESRTFPGKVVIGNSSTAYTSGSGEGGHVRKNCMSSQYDINKSVAQYLGNTHMWYPEHRDHDERDDHFSQIPYCSASQGSSGSEQDELRKAFRTLAAFKKPVKERLRAEGLIMPILQMIARRTRVTSAAEYLTGAAHPNAFDNYSNQDAMLELAYEIDADNIPPLVEVEILDHSYDGVSGKDYFTNRPELYFESHAATAFVFRDKTFTKEIIASARNSYDLNDRPLTYHWAVLRGETNHVRISPLTPNSSVVKIEIDYHSETTIEGTSRLTNLVSVGAFVHNGAYYSPPAFITSYSLNNEVRSYSNGKIQEISYVDGVIDPNISSAKIAWDKDVFQYDTDNSLSGWTRYHSDGSTEEFDQFGHCTSCPRHSAQGQVTFNGEPLAGVVVRARFTQPHEGPSYTTTDASGSFSFSHLREGAYYFEVEEPPAKYYISSYYRNVSSDQHNINLSVLCNTGYQQSGNECTAQYTFAGSVNLSGVGLEGVAITAQTESGAEYSTKTAANGTYILGVPGTGSYTLSAKKVGYVFSKAFWNNPLSLSSNPAQQQANFNVSCELWNQDPQCAPQGGKIPMAPRALRLIIR
jgi:hypothetical protein